MDYILLIVGFVLLIKGADIFVDGASNVAKKVGIPSVIVGLTIVSIGTSAPELSVSLISALDGSNGITIGNVLGSNIFNTLVVLGGTAIVAPIVFKKITIRRDYIVNTLVAILVFVLTFIIGFNGEAGVNRISGIILLILCILYITILVLAAKRDGAKDEDEEQSSMIKNIIMIVIGIAGIIIGGNFVVDSASNIALTFGMSEKLVGLTIVSIGTSLPELVTSIVAATKGENEIALGNVLGSNIFNILLILGTSTTISPILVDSKLMIDFIFFIAVTIFIGALIFFNKKKEEKKITRLEGLIFVLLYVAYLVYIIIRN